jgi:aspartyl aminopeptidase
VLIRDLARRVEVRIQDFIVRNDSGCGSTVGPILAAKAGIKTVDIGAPMLGMHSIRETCGTLDLLYYRRLFQSFYQNYSQIDHTLFDE